jgi:predicted nucleotidyltransferase
MGVLKTIKESIQKVGIKEIARRAHLSPSTVSRIGSGQAMPSLEVVERISKALGFRLELQQQVQRISAPRLKFTQKILITLESELKNLGVQHVVIFGSVARGEDGPDSDIDIYLDFGVNRPKVAKMLKAEGRILETFRENKVDIVSQLQTSRNQKLHQRIQKEGVRVF